MTRSAVKLTDSDLSRIHDLYRCGTPVRVIAKQFGVTWDTIKRRVDPKFAEFRNSKIRTWRFGRQSGDVIAEHSDPIFDPRRDGYPRHASASAELFGDPPIGRSALDKKRAAQTPRLAESSS